MLIDLQLHSINSDGYLDPTQVAGLCNDRGLKVVSLTDHNTVSGLEKFVLAVKKADLEFLEGIEISSRYKDFDMHILGYSLNFNKQLLRKELKHTLGGYNLRAKKLLRKCQAADLISEKFKFENLLEKKKDSYVSTRDIMLEIEKFKRIPYTEAAKLVARGTPLFEKMPSSGVLSPAQATNLLHRAGGISVLAHPYYITRQQKASGNPKKYLLEILKAGKFDGIEVYYSKHTMEEKKLFYQIAEQENLAVTGGSDWHGKKFTPNWPVGCQGINSKQFSALKNLIKKGQALLS